MRLFIESIVYHKSETYMTGKDVKKEVEYTFNPYWNLFLERLLRIFLARYVNAKDSWHILYYNKKVHNNKLPGTERSGAPHIEIIYENADLAGKLITNNIESINVRYT